MGSEPTPDLLASLGDPATPTAARLASAKEHGSLGRRELAEPFDMSLRRSPKHPKLSGEGPDSSSARAAQPRWQHAAAFKAFRRWSAIAPRIGFSALRAAFLEPNPGSVGEGLSDIQDGGSNDAQRKNQSAARDQTIDDRVLRISRRLKAPRARFQGVHRPHAIWRWFGPEGVTVSDFKRWIIVGGTFRVTWSAEGTPIGSSVSSRW